MTDNKEITIERGIARKRDKFLVRFYGADGRYHRETVSSLKEARRLRSVRNVEAEEGTKLPANLRNKGVLITFEEIANDALAWSAERRPQSHSVFSFRVGILIQIFGQLDATKISPEDLEAGLCKARDERKWGPASINRYRTCLQTVYRQAVKAKKVLSNPAREIEHRKEPRGVVRYLSGEEYNRLDAVIRTLYPEHHAEFVFALNTGLRAGSQRSANYSNLDLLRKELHLPTSKTGVALHVPLNPAALGALQSLPSWKGRSGLIFAAWQPKQEWFRQACKKAKVQNFRWHDLRHTFASWLVQSGVSLHLVSKLLGHASIRMTDEHYAHLAPNQKHQAVANLAAPVFESTTTAPSETENADTRINTGDRIM